MIDYNKIGCAVEHYSKLNYKYIEVPWIVSKESILVTAPPNVRLFSTFAGELVASGEQSFIEIRKELMKADGFPALFQCVTPCFRDEVVDDLHRQYFIKNELIGIPHSEHDRDDVPWALINYLVRNAVSFFKKYTDNINIVNAPLPTSIVNEDIMINGIEVGSYGYRYYEDFCWVYGTGCAEPRLSQALKG